MRVAESEEIEKTRQYELLESLGPSCGIKELRCLAHAGNSLLWDLL